MNNVPGIRPFILSILKRSAIIELVILLVVAVIGYFNGWLNGGVNFTEFGNVLFFVGIFEFIIGGFMVGGARQMPVASGAFIGLQSITTESDGNPEAKARLLGFVGFLKAYTVTLAFMVAGVVTLVLGALLQSIAFQ